ncbi:MAG TPA: bifunctional diaminohydroxyphosphoribosylaminopyrimidine deaminase/5-amino-6-(5-phosphoribosylamino)uracil reductase RibD, partial [Polyangia bacterium]|nr:bifunctional diaminohydroxyphosphoribosylaminopyrimidine deaminase/5-amino-6-(5-phosphoribosylamino)uracil reductase RibD [Polyangia bacterium]
MTGGFGEDDQRFMRRALALAKRGQGTTRPNPMVGAVVVKRGTILAEGFHLRPGTAHAEVAALSRLAGRAPGATLYVTLEPCCHTGRTPPCTDAVLASGVTRVVVGCPDANPVVDGKGIATLRRGGLRVDVGCLEDDCRSLTRAFFTWVRERRPLVTLKVAATWDGFIADGRPPKRGKAAPVWLTGEPARAVAHRLRGEHDAILVGAGTVHADDPRLTNRGRGAARQPLRVVLDGRLSIAPGAAVLKAPLKKGDAPALVLGARGARPSRVKALQAAGAEVELRPARQGRLAIVDVLRCLAARDVQSLLVEGGTDVHGAFIR